MGQKEGKAIAGEPVSLDPRLLAAILGREEDTEIDLVESGRLIWKKKWLIFGFAMSVSTIALVVSLTMPNIYRAEVLLAPVSSDEGNTGGLAGALGGLGGLASMAGIVLPGGGNTDQYLAILKSREFLWQFINKQKLMPVLFADDWNSKKAAWKEPKNAPTLWDAYRKLVGQILNVSAAKKTGLVTVTVEWKDAKQAAKWANALVDMLNDYLRKRAIGESQDSLAYLNRELSRTQLEDVRKALFGLISQEQKKAMLANTQVQYAFRVLDAADVPDKKAKPKRTLIVMVSLVSGALLAIVFVFFQEWLCHRKEEGQRRDEYDGC